ncbi:MAG: DUF1003 domain-containing protein, partial [Pseudomonadota bacterium]|nr:DUF1003 domain-containing protein [Pseudomonadota bacterium]
MPSPTVPPPRPADLSNTLTRNIAALETRRKAEAAARSWGERFADLVTQFAGSMLFVWLHAAVYGAWVVVNLGLVPGVPAFDKSFVILATEASVEGIFLSTFVLISQNKMTAAADKRANLDLQVNLLAEHEVTKLATMLASVMEHMGIPALEDREVKEIAQDVAPEAVLDALEQEDAG